MGVNQEEVSRVKGEFITHIPVHSLLKVLSFLLSEKKKNLNYLRIGNLKIIREIRSKVFKLQKRFRKKVTR